MTFSNKLGWFWKEPLVSTRRFDQYALIVFWRKTIRRRSEHTDRNNELKPTVLFRTTQLIRDSHYMVLLQTFLYRISTMQSFKSNFQITILKKFFFLPVCCALCFVFTEVFCVLFVLKQHHTPPWGQSSYGKRYIGRIDLFAEAREIQL